MRHTMAFFFLGNTTQHISPSVVAVSNSGITHTLDKCQRKAEDWPQLHQRFLCLAALRSLTP